MVDDAVASPSVEWNPAVARPVVNAAFEAGRRVFWIDDVSEWAPVDELPAGVVYVDTVPSIHARAVRRPR